MDKHDEFKTLLYQTVYDNFCDEAFALSQLKTLRDWIKSNLPKRLFRYRQFTENSLNALRNDEIWGSQVTKYNDPYEYIPCYDIKKVNQFLNREFDENVIEQQLSILKAGNIPQQFKSLFSEKTLHTLIENVAKIDDISTVSKGMSAQKPFVIQYLQSKFDAIIKDFFVGVAEAEKKYNVACFSENNNSSLMWGHYADGHKGFCLEYDFTENLTDCNQSCGNIRACSKFLLEIPIAPICYSEHRLDATAGILSIIQQRLKNEIKLGMNDYFFDMLLCIKCFLTKSSDWHYEREWRLFDYFSDEFKQYRPIMNKKAKAIYLGISMFQEHKQKLLSIAEEKEIPCYQVVPSYETSEFIYIPIRIFDGKKHLSELLEECGIENTPV